MIRIKFLFVLIVSAGLLSACGDSGSKASDPPSDVGASTETKCTWGADNWGSCNW